MVSRQSLEDAVYRASLAEDGRAVRGASPWATIPVTVAVCAVLGIPAVVLARKTPAGQKVLQTVAVVLQEGGAPAARPAAAPAAPAPRPAASVPTPAAAPPPVVQPKEPVPPPPDPRLQPVPQEAPKALPREDQSRLYGSSAGTGGPGSGSGAGGAGAGGPGGGSGSGAGSGARVIDLDFRQVGIRYRPPEPPYPALAKHAGIQGTVTVLILVGPDGIPVSARAVDGPFQLRAAAEANAMAWKFNPYVLNGVALKCQFKLTFTFKLTE